MPWCSVVRDGKDGGTLGPFAKGAVALTPYCFPVFSAHRAASPFPSPAASDLIHNESPVVTMLVASQQLWLLEMMTVISLAIPTPGMGTASRFMQRQLP